MKLKDVISVIRNSNLPNATERIITDDKNLVRLINEAVLAIYSQFEVKLEQAIILVPKHRNIFTISSSDPNVIMGTIEKLNKARALTDINSDKNSLLNKLNLDENTLRFLKNSKVTNLEEKIASDELLQIVSIADSERNEYNFNVDKVFTVNSNTLYFPECKEGMQIFVKYKVKPKIYNELSLDEEVELPENMLECLYAYINLKVISGIDGLKEFYPNVLNTYNQCLQRVLMEGHSLPADLRYSLHLKKGFY